MAQTIYSIAFIELSDHVDRRADGYTVYLECQGTVTDSSILRRLSDAKPKSLNYNHCSLE